MSRYKFTKIKKNLIGNRVYLPTLYPKIDIEDTDILIFTIEGDRLDTLAHKYYKDSSLWWIIASANNIKSDFALTPGIQLRIPQHISKIYQDLKKLNSDF